MSKAIFDFVRKNVSYISDPAGLELVQSPEFILTSETMAGDCDDQAALVSSMMIAAGIPTRLIVIGNNPDRMEHIYPEIYISGEWIPADTAETNFLGQPAPEASIKIIYDFNGGKKMYQPLYNDGLGVAPVLVTEALNTAGQLLDSLNPFKGQSAGFQYREAMSEDFFGKRNYLLSIMDNLTPEQQAKYWQLPHVNVDYNTRKENETERAALDAYIAWLDEDIRANAAKGTQNSTGQISTSGGQYTEAGLFSGSSILPLAVIGFIAWKML